MENNPIADRQRRLDFCPGCGYHWITHEHTHRADCNASDTRKQQLQRGQPVNRQV
jgi:hypothetical protein